MAEMKIYQSGQWVSKSDIKLYQSGTYNSKQGYVYTGGQWLEFTVPTFVVSQTYSVGTSQTFLIDQEHGFSYHGKQGFLEKRRLSDGVLVWSHTFTNPYAVLLTVVIDSSQNVYFCTNAAQMGLVKLNSAGTKQWTALSASDQWNDGIALDASGTYLYVGGHTSTSSYNINKLYRSNGTVYASKSGTTFSNEVSGYPKYMACSSDNSVFFSGGSSMYKYDSELNKVAVESVSTIKTEIVNDKIVLSRYVMNSPYYTQTLIYDTGFYRLNVGDKAGGSGVIYGKRIQDFHVLSNNHYFMLLEDVSNTGSGLGVYNVHRYDENNNLIKFKNISNGTKVPWKIQYAGFNNLYIVWKDSSGNFEHVKYTNIE